jgi:hypothetical protein
MERALFDRTEVGAKRGRTPDFAFFGPFPQRYRQAFPPILRKTDFVQAGVGFRGA